MSGEAVMFGFKSSKKTSGGDFTLQLNARLQPIHRGDRYEDPLEEILTKHKLGKTQGGGTLLSESGEIEHCDVELWLDDASDENLAKIVGMLGAFGVPKGSWLMGGGHKLAVGSNEGLAVYLNGTELDAKVYADCDSNVVYDTFNTLLGEHGQVESWWQGPTETALYLYGPSFETMRQSIAGFVDSYPLCQKARIVQIA